MNLSRIISNGAQSYKIWTWNVQFKRGRYVNFAIIFFHVIFNSLNIEMMDPSSSKSALKNFFKISDRIIPSSEITPETSLYHFARLWFNADKNLLKYSNIEVIPSQSEQPDILTSLEVLSGLSNISQDIILKKGNSSVNDDNHPYSKSADDNARNIFEHSGKNGCIQRKAKLRDLEDIKEALQFWARKCQVHQKERYLNKVKKSKLMLERRFEMRK